MYNIVTILLLFSFYTNAHGFQSQESETSSPFCVNTQDFQIQEFAIINEVVNYAKKHSVKEGLKDEDITAGMLKGALAEIDSHSTYFTKEEYKRLQESLGGSFSGIGVYIDVHEGLIRVSGVIKGMPAEKAGVKNGDYITHIGNESTFGSTLEDASSKLRGRKGTKVKVEIIRKGEEKPIEVTITRDNISFDTVSMKKIDDILVISLNYFNEQTFEDFTKLLKKQKGYKGIIVDVRSNPGGILDSAIAVSSLFVSQGNTIVQVSNVEDMKKNATSECIGSKKECRNIRYENRENKIAVINNHAPLIAEIPMVVLVNNYSASASEILALAIQENNRGYVIGQKTFGKGSVQTIIPLKEGERGALKLTTALYYSPKSKSIQAKGVTPDIIIPEFTVASQEKRNSFFPTNEAQTKNHITLPKTDDAEKPLEAVNIEDFALQTALASLKTSIIKNADNNQ